ncbi:MAG: hypothetical protein CM15mV40_710 [Caudoviricetes sp.]|nr:MAG: hypothetical protein CM15mV40_710 [Caudoviricetes sp.]
MLRFVKRLPRMQESIQHVGMIINTGHNFIQPTTHTLLIITTMIVMREVD